MKHSTLYAIFSAAMLAAASSANAAFSGDVSGGGLFSGEVSTDNGWITESAAGDGVDFWTLTVGANTTLSVSIDSFIDFGISIYKGEVSEFGFDNDTDYTDLFSGETGYYIGGTNGYFSDGGSSLENILLADAGVYTIAIGGDAGFGSYGPYNYDMTVSQVPLPAALPMFAAGLAGLAGLRRCRRNSI